jgi:hypothetical protein
MLHYFQVNYKQSKFILFFAINNQKSTMNTTNFQIEHLNVLIIIVTAFGFRRLLMEKRF